MPTPLKDLYNPNFFQLFGEQAKMVLPRFQSKEFVEKLFDKDWEQKELKERMKWAAICFRTFMHQDFELAAEQLIILVEKLKKAEFYETSVEFMFLPSIIEVYGLDYFDASMKAMTEVTQFTSCEFAVRPFYLKYPKEMLDQTVFWSKHSNFKVRRLSSEGIRPMLPWAMALPAYKQDPSDILPILENLKDDPEEYVRRSVANNLNDISKNQPELVLEIADRWFGEMENRNKLVKHALRTLLKNGNSRALAHFGYAKMKDLKFSNFEMLSPRVEIGEKLTFSFHLENISSNNVRIRLEYAIYYLKANASLSKKVFKISERDLEPNRKLKFQKDHSFRVISTRVFHPGVHKASVIVNGKEFESLEFLLTS